MTIAEVKKLVSLLAVAALCVIAYYGNYLPLKKSQAFIDALRRVSTTVRSVEDYERLYGSVLDMPSPIGHEELVRNLGGSVIGILSGANPNPPLTAELIKFLMKYYQPILDRGRGMSYSQNLYVLGNVHAISFLKTQDPQYLLAAEKFYSQGLEVSPRRPQFLYGLFDMARIRGDVAKVNEVYAKIHTYWPQDTRIKELYDAFLVQAAAAAKNTGR